MRAGIGLILIADLIIRINSVVAHYTDEGILPLSALKDHFGKDYTYSLHACSGAPWFQVLLFSAAFIFAILLVMGWRTKLATAISWLLLSSLQSRNPLIGQGGDDLLRILLFWGIFLPWGARYSADRIRKGNALPDNRYFDVPALGYGLLVFSVYFFSALLKTSPEWHSEGTALYYALSLDQLTLPLGKAIYPNPDLLNFLTHLTWYTELIAPLLLFVPVFNPFFRTLAVCAMIALHLGISLFLFVGLFFLIGIAAAVGLLPTVVMDKLEKRFNFLLRPLRKTGQIIFSGKKNAAPAEPDTFFGNFYFRLVLNSLLVFFMALCLLWNIGSVRGSGIGVSRNFQWLAQALRFEQCWNMFSPEVMKDDGWYITEGITSDSGKIDVTRQGEITDYSKPNVVLDHIDNDRWRKFGESYMQPVNEGIRIHYCNYLLRRWNREHPDKKVKRLNIVYMKETTEPDYKRVIPVRDVLCSCAADSLN